VAAATGQTSHKVIGTCNTATSFAPCSLVLGDLPSSLFTLTTSGTSGAATYSGGTLNIPQYSGGGGSSAFSAITAGTNTTAAMLVGTGASLGVTGSGTIAATSVPVAGVTSLTFTGSTTKAASSTGALVTGDCAKWDASGNAIDAGISCASAALPGGSGLVEVTSGAGGLVNLGASGALTYNTGTQTLDVSSSVLCLFGNACTWGALQTFQSVNEVQGSGTGPTVANTTGTVAVNTGSTNVAGTLTSSTSGTILFTLTWGGSIAYTHRAVCQFFDETTRTDSVQTTQATAPTTTTLTATGTTVSGDIVSYSCTGY
jgi:hypothetical protein